MKEKIIKSYIEGGEYLLSEDIVDVQNVQVPCVSIFFRKNGITDWESWKSAKSWKEAESLVASEIANAKKAR